MTAQREKHGRSDRHCLRQCDNSFAEEIIQCLEWLGWGPEMTDRGEYRCVVKEYASGAPWLAFEPLRDIELPELRGKILGIDLRPGVTFEEAREIARILDDHMVGIIITR